MQKDRVIYHTLSKRQPRKERRDASGLVCAWGAMRTPSKESRRRDKVDSLVGQGDYSLTSVGALGVSQADSKEKEIPDRRNKMNKNMKET